jgi:dTDP-4-amino-4,6-dideoxygalactose transaminase
MEFRRQLPVYSPIPASAARAAAAHLVGLGDDPRPQLTDLLQREYDSRHVLLCRSGTQALTIAIREACGRVNGATPLALPAFSCYDVGTAAIAADVCVSFYDLEPQTLAPDRESLERVLRAGARIVVIAPLYGVPLDWDALSALAGRYGAILIEDAAQGSGALWRGRRLGTLGETAALSFGRGKGWTGGHGGAFLTRSGDRAHATALATPGFSDQARGVFALAGQWALGRPAVYGIPSSIPALGLGETSYRPPQPERAIAKPAAAALLASREASEREAKARKTTARELLAAVAENSRVAAISIDHDATPGYLRLPLRVPGGMAAFGSPSRALALGISPSYPSSLADLPQLAARREGPERAWPGAQALVRELVTLPTHSRLRPRELAEIAAMLRSIRPRHR